LTKEYFIIGHGFAEDFHQTTLLSEPPEDQDLPIRVDRGIRFVASASAGMEEACAGWANDKRITIVPIAEAKARNAVAQDQAQEVLFDLLRGSLWRRDWALLPRVRGVPEAAPDTGEQHNPDAAPAVFRFPLMSSR
jgi:hypothetical protein